MLCHSRFYVIDSLWILPLVPMLGISMFMQSILFASMVQFPVLIETPCLEPLKVTKTVERGRLSELMIEAKTLYKSQQKKKKPELEKAK